MNTDKMEYFKVKHEVNQPIIHNVRFREYDDNSNSNSNSSSNSNSNSNPNSNPDSNPDSNPNRNNNSDSII